MAFVYFFSNIFIYQPKKRTKTIQNLAINFFSYEMLFIHCFHLLLSFKAKSRQRKVLDQYRPNFPIYHTRTIFPMNNISIHFASSMKNITVVIKQLQTYYMLFGSNFFIQFLENDKFYRKNFHLIMSLIISHTIIFVCYVRI